MDTFAELAQKIIHEQENIIGPIAIEQARKVPGLIIGDNAQDIRFNGDQKSVLETLVEKYRDLFGNASVEVCRNATKDFLTKIPHEQLPPLLQ